MGTYKKQIQFAILLILLVIAGLTVASSLTKESKYPKVGETAPDFKLVSLDGKSHSLSENKGKVVVVNFWATYCEPCRHEMPAIQNQAEKWKSNDVAVIGVNIAEKRFIVQSFIDQIGVKFPILLDDQEEIRRRYGVREYPTTFFIGNDGKIKTIKVGWMDESFIESTLTGLLSPPKGVAP